MLINTRTTVGHRLSAMDGDIGHVRDFYFDDGTWAVRYIVAETGSWLTGRLVLLSPYSFGTYNFDDRVLPINLTRRQIENSPSIETHRPVSRQFEHNYYNYYGWPLYWEGGGMWGSADYPTFTPLTPDYSVRSYEYDRWDDIHLRSAAAVTGYGIEARDGPMGKVSGLMVDDRRWTVRQLAVETGHWYAGKEIRIPPTMVERISHADAKVFVNLTKADIAKTVANAVVEAAI